MKAARQGNSNCLGHRFFPRFGQLRGAYTVALGPDKAVDINKEWGSGCRIFGWKPFFSSLEQCNTPSIAHWQEGGAKFVLRYMLFGRSITRCNNRICREHEAGCVVRVSQEISRSTP